MIKWAELHGVEVSAFTAVRRDFSVPAGGILGGSVPLSSAEELKPPFFGRRYTQANVRGLKRLKG